MYVGHINLAESFNGAGEHFVGLIEALQKKGVEQYVLVRNVALAKRLDIIDNVTVGPVVRSAVTAYCLMPRVDVLHVHDRSSRAAGLLATLTQSVPFVLTNEITIATDRNPISQAAIKRAAGFIEENEIDVATHLEVYQYAIAALKTPRECR